MEQSKEQPTIMVRGKTYPLKTGDPFMKTILQRVKKAGLDNFLVRQTHPDGTSTILEMENAPKLIQNGMLIEVTPYDQAGVSHADIQEVFAMLWISVGIFAYDTNLIIIAVLAWVLALFNLGTSVWNAVERK